LARCTDDLPQRLHFFTRAYETLLEEDPHERDVLEAGRDRYEAGWLLQEMGRIHEKQGELAKAADCYERALVHMQEGSDLCETHFLDEDGHNSEVETFRRRPQVIADLARLKKRLPKD